jgi:hypothetical protein
MARGDQPPGRARSQHRCEAESVVGSRCEAGNTGVQRQRPAAECDAAERYTTAERSSGASSNQSSQCTCIQHRREAEPVVCTGCEAGSVALQCKCPAAEYASAAGRTAAERCIAHGKQSAKRASTQRHRETEYRLGSPRREARSAGVQPQCPAEYASTERRRAVENGSAARYQQSTERALTTT